MQLKLTILTATALGLIAAPNAANAVEPLELEYSVTDAGGGLFDYAFELTLTNDDGSWIAGQQWDWIVFGDVSFPDMSPLSDFSDFSSPDSELGLTSSGGAHNGPTLFYGSSVLLPGWTPSAVGDSLSWSGTSSANLLQGNLQWSTIVTGDGARAIDFATATRIETAAAVPEPSTWALLLLGFGAVGAVLRARGRNVRISYT